MKEIKETFINVDDMPKDAYVASPKKSDDELLDKLLGTPDETTKEVYMKRFDAYFTVKAISSEEYSSLEKRCKYPVKNARTHHIEEKINQDMLSNLLIVTACIKPDWSNPQLFKRYNTDDPIKVIRKRLYIGEIAELTNAIMDISGFDDGLEEIKNLYKEVEKPK